MFAYPLPESFPFLRRHGLPALRHSTAKTGTRGTVAPKSAEQDPAQRENPKRLPEGNLAPAEDRRQQPIPKLPHYFTSEGDE
jgi:hypothetical protein